ncbi:MAG: DUF5677 domain-containing protein [Actinomycetota bacterium]|nr:DUF5677 domain-containing protein [Actinomycetota bacterium]
MDASQNVLAALESAILIDDDPERAVDLFVEEAGDVLFDLRSEHSLMQARIADRWEGAFDLYELFRASAFALAQRAWAPEEASTRTDLERRIAVRLLFVRAYVTAGEILALIRTGFGNGAVARWRTMHEVEVVATLLATAEDDTVRRYGDYLAYETWRTLETYERHHEELGWEALPAEEMKAITERGQDVRREYRGKLARSSYEWARRELSGGLPELADDATQVELRHLEEHVGLTARRALYQLASDAVHAGWKAARGYELLLEPDELSVGWETQATISSLKATLDAFLVLHELAVPEEVSDAFEELFHRAHDAFAETDA